MPELIDRQAALAEIEKFKILFNETMDSHKRVAYLTADHCMLVIKAAPTIEAEPVRHGRWIVRIIDIGVGDKIRMLRCSECSKYANMKFDFCPNCGAKMEWRDEEWH